ncbi:MAG: hypothetical protein QNJ15_00405 [Erythrobacter sp.]|nr:hypothetical protein [Erythrobacter sp.]
MRTAVPLGVLAALMLSAPASAEHLFPRNECAALPGADRFQMRLVTAVANRNADMLRPIVDPQIKLDFGGGEGWDLFKARLEAGEYDLWAELDKVIRLGCADAYRGSMAMPYYWPKDLGFDDPYSTYVATGDDIPLLAEPREDARQLRLLNWESVEVPRTQPYEDGQRFVAIRTRAGEAGFAELDRLRSQIDFRMIAERREGQWRITVFIAGD